MSLQQKKGRREERLGKTKGDDAGWFDIRTWRHICIRDD